MIHTERSLVGGELYHHGTPFVPESPLSTPMKLKLRGATATDIQLADELQRSLRGYSQDSILLMLAIVYHDWRALEGVIAKQRRVLAASAATKKAREPSSLARRIAAHAPQPGATDVLADLRARHVAMTRAEFKARWESDANGGGITYDDIATCARAWGVLGHPRTRPMEEVRAAVLRAAGVAEETP